MPHDEQHYYEYFQKDGGRFQFRIYHYDKTGNKQIFVHKSEFKYMTAEEAEDAACEWAEEHGIDAELS